MVVTCRNIRDTLQNTPRCREKVINLQLPAAKPLHEYHVTMGGISDLCAGYELGCTAPQHTLLLYTLEGTGRFITPDALHLLKPGYLLIAPPQSPYAYSVEGQKWRTLWYHIGASESRRAPRVTQIHIRRSFQILNLEAVTNGFLSESLRTDSASPRSAHLFAELIVSYLNRELETESEPGMRIFHERLHRLWDTVNANLQEDWTVAKLAAHMHISTSYLHRICLNVTGLCPMRMVTRLRMHRAEEYLKQGYLLKTIAEQIGYQNTFAFSVAFKRYFGCSPREFKNKNSVA